MTDFKDRERAEEAKFALDEETAFRVAARRNRLLGEWAAGLMALTPEETEAYKKAVVQADFEEAGDEDVIRNRWAVYEKEGERCPACSCGGAGGGIRRIVQSGRSTFYCPRRQR